MTDQNKTMGRAIVRPPSANFAEGLTSVDLGVPVYQRALEEHEAYCAALQECGLRLTRLEADPHYPDSTFVEDTAVLIEALPYGRATAPVSAGERCAILARPGAGSRVGEVATMQQWLAQFYSELHSIREPGTLDGGDVCEAGNHFFIGISKRTNEEGAQQLAELLASFGLNSSFVDIRGVKNILHLKSGVAYLGDDRLALIDALADRDEFRGYNLIRVSAGEEYAANCLRVNDHVLMAAHYPALERSMRDLGYQTISLEMSEFRKMDGGLSCLSLRF